MVTKCGAGFVPYGYEGQWVYTVYGWTWVSYYDWGWAPFHYGRWLYDDYYGWIWVPDTEWGPCWVVWASGDGYYGWRPMEPGVSISLSFSRNYITNYSSWTFVRYGDIERSHVHRYIARRSANESILQKSRIIRETYNDSRSNVTYVSGPSRDDVQRLTGRRINTVSINENEHPGQKLRNNRLSIYRPEIRRNTDHQRMPEPSKVYKLKEIRRSPERSTGRSPEITNPRRNNIMREQQKPTKSTQRPDIKRQRQERRKEVNPSENNRRTNSAEKTTPNNSKRAQRGASKKQKKK